MQSTSACACERRFRELLVVAGTLDLLRRNRLEAQQAFGALARVSCEVDRGLTRVSLAIAFCASSARAR